jgi:glycosyltransferase involved in cell wall biosynthesis
VEGAAKHELVARCRAILFPCWWAEPLSTVAYEAYELGKPILASNLGGMKEIIVDGQTGWLLEPNNPAVWLEAIRRLEAAPARRIGLAGRRWLEQNASPETWNRHFTAIVRQAMQER